MMPDRAAAEAQDRSDPLAAYRERFVFQDSDVIYLAGNSLGRMPRASLARIERAVDQWAGRLVEGWDEWLDLPSRIGDLMAGPILGARPGEVIISDSTSVNLYKLAMAALSAAHPRSTIVTHADDFPTDRYILEGLPARRRRLIDDVSSLAAALDDDVALVCLSHINYRTAAVADMAAITATVHAAGALMLWDLSHSAGCYPIALDAIGADLAVGCTYKYLCAGPGAPAFIYVRSDLQRRLRQPIWGWFGQANQFAMGPGYDPWPDIRQFLVGTPPVLALAGVQGGIEIICQAGVAAIREKAVALGQLAVHLHQPWLQPLGFTLASPTDGCNRGSHLALHHVDAQRIHAALARDGLVITDLRFPNTIRMGLSPLTTRFVDVWDALDRLRQLSY